MILESNNYCLKQNQSYSTNHIKKKKKLQVYNHVVVFKYKNLGMTFMDLYLDDSSYGVISEVLKGKEHLPLPTSRTIKETCLKFL